MRVVWVAACLVIAAVTITPLPATPDGQVDYLILRAGWDGYDPTAPTFELAEHYQLPGTYSTELSVSRTPGFYLSNLFQLPDLHFGIWLIRVLNVAGAVMLGRVAAKVWGVRWWTVTVPAVLLGWGWIAWATPGLFWHGLLAAGLFRAVDEDDWLAGVAVGFVGAVRAWPAILIVVLWMIGRRRTALVGAVTGLTVTVLGLLAVPGVTVARMVRSLSDQGWALIHPSNLSLSTLLSRVGVPSMLTVVVGVLAVGWVVRGMGAVRAFRVGIVAGIVLSPIAWLHYLTAVLPWLTVRRMSER